MALVSLDLAVAGQVATAAFYNNNNNALLNQINGNLDATNIADLAITAAKIASNAVTTSKILDGAVTGPKISMGSDARGDILVRGSSVYQRMALITAGKVYGSDGTDVVALDALQNAEVQSFTRLTDAASGNQTLTFAKIPVFLYIMWSEVDTNVCYGWGVYAVTGTGKCIKVDGSGFSVVSTSLFVNALDNGGAGQSAVISGSLGLTTTIAFTKVGAATSKTLTFIVAALQNGR